MTFIQYRMNKSYHVTEHGKTNRTWYRTLMKRTKKYKQDSKLIEVK